MPSSTLSAPPPTLVGQPVPRREDEHVLRGEARYVDDVELPGPAGNLCRCTDYVGIVEAVRLAAERAVRLEAAPAARSFAA